MKQTVLTVFFTGLISLSAYSQRAIEQVLMEIEKNNKSLLTESEYRHAQKLSYKTGLTPENPKAEFDYMVGRPEGAGNQRDIVITQGIDFPTSFGKRKQVSEQKMIQADYAFHVLRQDLLLEAKQLCLDYIFKTRLQHQLVKRLQNAQRLLSATLEQTNRGEVSILDLNKVKLLRLEIKSQYDGNENELKRIQNKLDELNGGSHLQVEGLTVSDGDRLPPFEELDSLIEVNDPAIRSIKQEREISARELALTKALALPRLEGGYHQQAILGQTYEGFHLGMTIPLWEHRNRTKAQQSKLTYRELAVQEHRTSNYFRNKQWYEEYLHWQQTVAEYESILASANNEELLDKALQQGQINLIQYLMETRYFYDAVDRYLEADRALAGTVARLLKFQL